MLSYLPLSPTSSPILKLAIYTLSREERTPRRRSCSCTCCCLASRVINRTSFSLKLISPSPPTPPPSFTPLLSTILAGLRREWLFSFGSSSTAQTAARRKEKEIEERRGRRGRGIFLGGISPSLFKCSAIEE